MFANHVALVEWPDRLGQHQPAERLEIESGPAQPQKRRSKERFGNSGKGIRLWMRSRGEKGFKSQGDTFQATLSACQDALPGPPRRFLGSGPGAVGRTVVLRPVGARWSKLLEPWAGLGSVGDLPQPKLAEVPKAPHKTASAIWNALTHQNPQTNIW